MNSSTFSIKTLEELAKETEINTPRTFALLKDKFISFFIKTDRPRVERLKKAQSVSVEVMYSPEFNGISIIMCPFDEVIDDRDTAIKKYGVAGFVSASSKDAITLLKMVVDNKAIAHFYVISDDYEVISAKPIFITEMSKLVLEKQLKLL